MRHTRLEGVDGLCYGRTDMSLAPTFPADAALALQRVPKVGAIVTSPLTRCRRLALHIGNALNLTPEVDDRFAEMDFGSWEGRRWDDVPREGLECWARDFLDARPHGGESVAMLGQRVREGLEAHRPPGDAPTLVVTHLGVIRAALAHYDSPAGWQAKLGFGETVTIN